MRSHIFKKVCLAGLVSLCSFFVLISNANTQFDQKLICFFKKAFAAEDSEPPFFQEPLIQGKPIEGQKLEYAPQEVIVGFKEGIEPQSVLEAVDIEVEAIGRVHSIKPVVARLRKTHELGKDSEGWYWFLGKQYKEVEDISEDDLFKEAYNQMSPQEQVLYHSYKIKLTGETTVEEAVAKFESNPEVEYAEPNYLMHTFYRPDDSYYHYQWAHQNTDAEAGWDTAGVWDTDGGDSNITIAVIDTGIDYDHEDLRDNIWINEDEIIGNSIDDDRNGYIDDRRGWDFSGPILYYIDPDNDPYPDPDPDYPSGYDSHGTHCAGISAAVGNNNKGVIGVAPKAKIMALKIFPNAYSDVSAEAVRYAVDNGARVINMSYGSYYESYSNLQKRALDYADSEGVVLVAAAGNGDTTARFYPAGYENVIAVGATARDDTRAGYSNYGYWIYVVAPGGYYKTDYEEEMILSTWPSWYGFMQGTSMASPYVAGLAALLLYQNPSLTNTQIYEILRDSADDIGSFYYFGYGRVNVARACEMATAPVIVAEIDVPGPGQTINQEITIEGTATATKFSRYNVEVGEGENPSEWMSLGISLINGGLKEVESGPLARWYPTTYVEGIYTIRLTVLDTTGSSEEARVKVRISFPPPLQQGWPQYIAPDGSVNNEGRGSSIMADIDGDNDLEIITSTSRGQVFVWHHNGELADGWPIAIGSNPATPAVADLDLDGYMEIVVGCGTRPSLYVLNHNGTPYSGAWPKEEDINYISTASTLVDLDGDGDLEIVVGNERRQMCVWHHTGEPLTDSGGNAIWPVSVQDSQHITTPAVADIDGDGELEVVAAEGTSYGYEGTYGKLYAWNADGTEVSGNWPVEVGGAKNPPAIGDIDGDGQLEVVINARGGLFAVEADGTYDGNIWPKLSVLEGNGVPALGDLDGDDIPEIIIAGSVADTHKVWVLRGDGSNFWDPDQKPASLSGGAVDGATIANVDAEQSQEVIVLADGSMYIFKNDGILISGYPKYFNVKGQTTPPVADIDGDGDVEIAVYAKKSTTAYTPTPFYVYDLRGYCTDRKSGWPTFAHDAQHTGFYSRSDTTPPTTPVVTDEGETTTSLSQLYAEWASEDLESGISEYQYRITRDSETGDIVKNWTSTGIDTKVTAFASLSDGESYYFGVKAKNGVGLWSMVGYSDGITVVSPTTLEILTDILLETEVGEPYSVDLQAQGGTPPYSWSLIGGALPPGLTLSSAGIISGTPTTAGGYTFTVEVEDAAGATDNQTLSLDVIGTVPPLKILTDILLETEVGEPYSVDLQAQGGTPPYSWSLIGGALPPGLTLSSAGIISGTPTTAGSYTFTVEVEDAAGATDDQILSLAVIGDVSFTLTAEPDSVSPGEAITVRWTAPKDQISRTDWIGLYEVGAPNRSYLAYKYTFGVISGSVIFTAPNQEKTYEFRYLPKNGYNDVATSNPVEVTQAPAPLEILTDILLETEVGKPYSVDLQAQGGTPPYSWSLIGGALPPGLTLSSAGIISGTPTTAGGYTFTVEVEDAAGATDNQTLSLDVIETVPPLEITTTNLPQGTEDVAYSATLQAEGGTPPYSWSLIGGALPSGLTLSSAGVISGTPTAAGNYTFTVEVEDNAGATDSKILTLEVIEIIPPLEIITDTLPEATVGDSYNATLEAEGGTPPYSWSLIGGDLPSGLTLSNEGVISGMPTAAGNYNFTIQVRDSTQATDNKQFTLQISEGGGDFTLSASPDSVSPGEAITVSWTASEAFSTDWIGLYEVGASNYSYLAYRYTGGTTTGSVTFTAPSQEGTYEFRYLPKNGYDVAATSNSVEVKTAPIPGDFTLSASPDTISPGEAITVSWTASEASSTDWIGLYEVGASNYSYLAYKYPGGAETGSVTFAAPNEEGTYEFRYLPNNGYDVAATSNAVEVAGVAP